MQRVLVIQTAFIGDVVLTTPLLEAVRAKWPAAAIDVVATPQGCELLAGLAGVRCHALDKKGESRAKGIARVLDSLGRDAEFDLVLCVHRSPRSLWIAKKAKARRRVAFASFWSRLAGFETVPYPDYSEQTHYADKPLKLLERVLGENVPTPKPRLAEELAARDSLAAKLKGGLAGKPYLVVSPFSVWGTKMWFADRFARACAEIARREGLAVVVIGGGAGSEDVVGRTIAEKIRAAGGTAVDLVGRTSLAELKSLIRGARLVLANDSAPVHVAAAFNVPTVAIFGPTVRKWGFFPLSDSAFVVERSDVPCRPCHIHGPPKCPKGHFRCMDRIQVEDVVEAVQNLLR